MFVTSFPTKTANFLLVCKPADVLTPKSPRHSHTDSSFTSPQFAFLHSHFPGLCKRTLTLQHLKVVETRYVKDKSALQMYKMCIQSGGGFDSTVHSNIYNNQPIQIYRTKLMCLTASKLIKESEKLIFRKKLL